MCPDERGFRNEMKLFKSNSNNMDKIACGDAGHLPCLCLTLILAAA